MLVNSILRTFLMPSLSPFSKIVGVRSRDVWSKMTSPPPLGHAQDHERSKLCWEKKTTHIVRVGVCNNWWAGPHKLRRGEWNCRCGHTRRRRIIRVSRTLFRGHQIREDTDKPHPSSSPLGKTPRERTQGFDSILQTTASMRKDCQLERQSRKRLHVHKS